eukprot:5643962-Karenia_brevis.AAC.1
MPARELPLPEATSLHLQVLGALASAAMLKLAALFPSICATSRASQDRRRRNLQNTNCDHCVAQIVLALLMSPCQWLIEAGLDLYFSSCCHFQLGLTDGLRVLHRLVVQPSLMLTSPPGSFFDQLD